MSIVIIVSIYKTVTPKKKKNKKTKTENPRLIIWMSHSIVSICQDASTNGVCRVSCQGEGNTLRSCAEKYNILPCYGERRTNRERRFSEPPQNPSTSISMYYIYYQRNKHKNASNDDKCGIEVLMPNTKYARISFERICNNDIIPDIIHDKISAKRILIFDYLCT